MAPSATGTPSDFAAHQGFWRIHRCGATVPAGVPRELLRRIAGIFSALELVIAKCEAAKLT